VPLRRHPQAALKNGALFFFFYYAGQGKKETKKNAVGGTDARFLQSPFLAAEEMRK